MVLENKNLIFAVFKIVSSGFKTLYNDFKFNVICFILIITKS